MSSNTEERAYIESIFEKNMRSIGIQLSEYQMEQFYKYYSLLIDWNQKINLTSITDIRDVYEKHFLDSSCGVLAIEKYGVSEKLRMIDVGTGGGFPGVPLKIIYPDMHITLLDSLNKRIQFLNEIIQELGLKNIETIHGRAEEMGRHKDFRENYDISVSRAVANLSTLSEYCTPFLNKDGFFISYKSKNVDEELEQSKIALSKLNTMVDNVIQYDLPGTDVARTLVMIKKTGKTPSAYPRKAGTPQKKPLS